MKTILFAGIAIIAGIITLRKISRIDNCNT